MNNDNFDIQCGDHTHDSFWKTVVQSPQWEAWCKEVSRRFQEQKDLPIVSGVYDVDECAECGWISKEHFQDFIKFIEDSVTPI